MGGTPLGHSLLDPSRGGGGGGTDCACAPEGSPFAGAHTSGGSALWPTTRSSACRLTKVTCTRYHTYAQTEGKPTLDSRPDLTKTARTPAAKAPWKMYIAMYVYILCTYICTQYILHHYRTSNITFICLCLSIPSHFFRWLRSHQDQISNHVDRLEAKSRNV